MGNKLAFINMVDEAIPSIFKYYLIVYQNNQSLAVEASVKVLEKSFLKLNSWTQQKLFIHWLLSDIEPLINENLRTDFKDNQFLKLFTEVYSWGLNYCRFSFELNANTSFSPSDIKVAKEIISSQNEIGLSEECVGQIKNKLKQSSSNLGFLFKKNKMAVLFAVSISAIFFISVFLYNKNHVEKSGIDFEKLKTIQAPIGIIFGDYYDKLIDSQEDSEILEDEIVDLKEELPAKDEKQLTLPTDTKEDKPAESELHKENKSIEEKSTDKPIEIKVETQKLEKENPKKDIKNGMAEIEPIIEDDPKTEDATEVNENQQEIVVIKGNEIPLIHKNELNKNDGAIRIGGDDKKYELKEYKDQKVIFYSFLEVKDVEKAKDSAFKILTKFGYKGEVLKKEKDYLILTATFPGKVNHDRMIRKFNGLGTLYVGNDVAEFLDLYKTDLDKERSRFFPKYKPEDLPKEVTVNLYVFPKQQKK